MTKTRRLTHIVWFRLDLRVCDNSALTEAAKGGARILPIFIWQPDESSPWQPGKASCWWLHHSLSRLQDQLLRLGTRLIIRHGPSERVLKEIINETGATAVFWNRIYEPNIINRDASIKVALKECGIAVRTFNSSLLKEPWEIQNSQRKPFQVFTPFWRKLSSDVTFSEPLPAPKIFKANTKVETLSLDTLGLLPKKNWADQFPKYWNPGEEGAKAALQMFIKSQLSRYATDRDRPGVSATSRLAAHLHFGEIGPRQVWHAIQISSTHTLRTAEPFLRQLGWRDFAHHLLYHFPQTPLDPLRQEFTKFPWKRNKKHLEAWQKGMTGYPIVDAGMRELWSTGTMHNRVRMIVASFLVKDLLQPWQDGARWFWDTLVDADLANNTLGWQWVAGCGADAAPYFRVFNPILQGKKFDPRGDYVRRWVPELAQLSNKWIHCPWDCPKAELKKAGIDLGATYPRPIVDHAEARDEALEAYEELRSKCQTIS